MNTYVVIADASRALIFVLDSHGSMAEGHLTRLVPIKELEQPERRERPSERYSDTRPGLHQASSSGPAHGVDDGRDAQQAESDRRFAVEIVNALQRAVQGQPPARIVMAASPNMLGILRNESSSLRNVAELHELAKDLTSMSVTAIHDYLARRELIPERGRRMW